MHAVVVLNVSRAMQGSDVLPTKKGKKGTKSGLSRGTQCSVTSHTGTGTHNGAGHLLDGGGARGCPLPVKNQDRGEDPECVYVSVCLSM